MAKVNKPKKANKHASNLRRRERKALRTKRKREAPSYVSPGGKCGSSFCTARTGCEPWK